MEKPLDYTDVVLHGLGGAGVGILAALSGWHILIVANAIGWYLRERFQHPNQLYYPFGASMQTNLEWFVPSVTCLAALVTALAWRAFA